MFNGVLLSVSRIDLCKVSLVDESAGLHSFGSVCVRENDDESAFLTYSSYIKSQAMISNQKHN